MLPFLKSTAPQNLEIREATSRFSCGRSLLSVVPCSHDLLQTHYEPVLCVTSYSKSTGQRRQTEAINAT